MSHVVFSFQGLYKVDLPEDKLTDADKGDTRLLKMLWAKLREDENAILQTFKDYLMTIYINLENADDIATALNYQENNYESYLEAVADCSDELKDFATQVYGDANGMSDDRKDYCLNYINDNFGKLQVVFAEFKLVPIAPVTLPQGQPGSTYNADINNQTQNNENK